MLQHLGKRSAFYETVYIEHYRTTQTTPSARWSIANLSVRLCKLQFSNPQLRHDPKFWGYGSTYVKIGQSHVREYPNKLSVTVQGGTPQCSYVCGLMFTPWTSPDPKNKSAEVYTRQEAGHSEIQDLQPTPSWRDGNPLTCSDYFILIFWVYIYIYILYIYIYIYV